MTVIIKDVPGLTTRELLDALLDITDSVATGHGGFVVDEDVAEQFLSAYLIASGQRPAPTGTPDVVGPPSGQTGRVEPTEPVGPVPARPTTRRTTRQRRGA